MEKTLEIIRNDFHTKSMGLRAVNDFYIYKRDNEFGVALDNINNVKINEVFSSVQIKNLEVSLNIIDVKKLIVLVSTLSTHKNEFASLCMQFIELGKENSNRNLILNEPILWWEKWKELIGNRMYNPKPYDIIAELLTLERLYIEKEEEIKWSGPSRSSIDIQTKNTFYEVKSSLIRYENEITIASQFQLGIGEIEKKPEILMFYKMEELDNAETIDSVINRLESLEPVIIDDVELKLSNIGYPKHSSGRKKSFVIHEIRRYIIDENFPKITMSSFKDDKVPSNIKKISYTINLDNLEYDIIK